MSNYIFAYHGGKAPDSPEAGAQLMARWNTWLGGLGDTVVNPGAPVGMSKTVSAGAVLDDGGTNPLSGFSIIKAESMEAAVKISQGCPHLDSGTIEIAQTLDM